MKIAISGKGGVGKTTLSSLLAMAYAEAGQRVIAIDANPDANLAMALGIPPQEAQKIKPIAELEDLIYERTGAQKGSVGTFFKINPEVSDIPERFSAKRDGIRLLVMGTVRGGGAGCICPESAVLRALLSHLLIGRSDVVIMDMDAGVEHLGRGTAGAVDAFIIVVEPGQRSVQTARAVKRLAKDLGIERCYVVGTKTKDESQRSFIRESLPDFPILGFIDYSAAIAEADLKGLNVYEAVPEAAQAAKRIKGELEKVLSGEV